MQTELTQKQILRELKYSLSEDLRKMRKIRELSIEELFEKTSIRVGILKELEMGSFKDWGTLLRLARFYGKKVRIEFYE